MRYIDRTMDPSNQSDEVIPTIKDTDNTDSSDKKVKAHVIRRNVEDYLERKALERSLKEVFDDDYLLD